jgi:preprotein translocase subunit SecE
MSRAMRRHPVVDTKPGRPSRAPALRPGARQPQRAAREKSRGVLGLLQPHWAMEIISELRKVTWPTREETWYLTVVVLVVAGAVGLFLGGVDIFFNWAIERTLLR